MGKYENDAKRLLDLIGGKENIQAVSHCMTRMRFVLVDPKKADEKAIEELPSVKGTFTQAGQYQVIIGNDVSVFYNEFTSYAGIEGVSKDAVKAAAKTNQNPLQKIMGTLGEIFAPLIPALICGGLVLGFRNVIGEINFFNNNTQSLADISQFWAGTYNFLWLIGEAVFHLLPVGIVWSITKKMGTTQILGIILGLTLVSPQLLNGFSVATTAPEDIPVWDFGFAQVQMIGYQGQVISAMLAGFVLVFLEKFFRKKGARLRKDACVLPVCLYAWILLKQGRNEEALKVLVDAKKKTSDETLIRNWEALANGRPKQFSNAGLGDMWYALGLEEPKMPRVQQQYRFR